MSSTVQRFALGGLLLGAMFLLGFNLVHISNTKASVGQTSSPSEVVKVPGITFTEQEKTSPKSTVKSVKPLTLNLDRTIELQGEIGQNAVAAAIRIAQLDAYSNADITILIDSPGGSVIDGARLISAMQTSKSKIKTVCLSLCASMGFMIHQYGNERLALDRAVLMAHPASAGTQGNVDNMVNFVSLLQRYVNKMEAEVGARMGIAFEKYKNKTVSEYWVDSEDALKDKTVDELVYIALDLNQLTPPEDPSTPVIVTPNEEEMKTRQKRAFDIIWILPPQYKRN